VSAVRVPWGLDTGWCGVTTQVVRLEAGLCKLSHFWVFRGVTTPTARCFVRKRVTSTPNNESKWLFRRDEEEERRKQSKDTRRQKVFLRIGVVQIFRSF
jgi:hypothetical protein